MLGIRNAPAWGSINGLIFVDLNFGGGSNAIPASWRLSRQQMVNRFNPDRERAIATQDSVTK